MKAIESGSFIIKLSQFLIVRVFLAPIVTAWAADFLFVS